MRGQRHAPAAFYPRKGPVPIVQEAGWTSGPVWTGTENLAPTGIRSLDRSARSQSIYRLSYLAHHGALFFTLFRYHDSTCFGLFLAQNQEAKCTSIMWQWYFFYFYSDFLRAWMRSNCSAFSSKPADSRFKSTVNTIAILCLLMID
jgi:hypothetical protein